MSYSGDHETSHLCSYTFEKGAQGFAGRPALQRRLRPASLPDTPGERPGRDRAAHIAENLGCASQTVRDAIHDFNRRGLDALVAGSSRPKQTHTAFCKEQTQALEELLHHSPREFARDSTLWTLEMAAQVSFEEGITEKRVSAETIRATLARLGKGWQRAPSIGSRAPIRIRVVSAGA